MTKQKNIPPYHIARRVGEQKVRPPTKHQAGIKKCATGEKLLPQTEQKESLLNCRLTKNIATINIRYLRNNHKLYELTYLYRYNLYTRTQVISSRRNNKILQYWKLLDTRYKSCRKSNKQRYH